MINSLIKFIKADKPIKTKAEIKKEKKQKLEEKKKEDEKQKAINELQIKWKYLMGQTDTFNKFKKSFGLNNIEYTDYGFSLRIYAPTALYLNELDKLKPYIETEFACEFIYKLRYTKNNVYADAKIVHPDKVRCNSIPFVPYKVKAYEIYAGVNVAGEPIVKNVNTHSHILICGATRRGKNGGLDHILTSWIHHCSEKEIQLYLFQCAKKDLKKYQNCKQVYGYTEDLLEMYFILEHVLDDMKRKSLLLEPMLMSLKGDNIYDYNATHKGSELPYTYVVIDEFLALVPEESDTKKVKQLKLAIQDKLRAIGQHGGSVGTNFVISHQKPEKIYCPSFLKNMSNIRICFGFNDRICSQIVLGNDMAVGLAPRKAIVYDGEEFEIIYTTDLRDRMEKYLRSSISLKHRTIFDDFKKMGLNIVSPFKDEKSKDKNTDTFKPESTGKEDVSYEVFLLQKEQEVKQREEEINNKLKLLECKQQDIIKQRELMKDDYDKIEKSVDTLLNESKNKNSNWVEYQPIKSGKEKVK